MNEQQPLMQIVNWDAFEHGGYSILDIKDSPTLLNIICEHDGAAVYGIWALLVDLCRRQPAPRSGWLTEDGKREGSRYTLETLAGLFHRPQIEILRMFQETTNRGIGWIRFV